MIAVNIRVTSLWTVELNFDNDLSFETFYRKFQKTALYEEYMTYYSTGDTEIILYYQMEWQMTDRGIPRFHAGCGDSFEFWLRMAWKTVCEFSRPGKIAL